MDNNIELTVLKEMLGKLIENLKMQVDQKNPIYIEFYRYLVITHLLLMK